MIQFYTHIANSVVQIFRSAAEICTWNETENGGH